jgi:hypothetical protein
MRTTVVPLDAPRHHRAHQQLGHFKMLKVREHQPVTVR